MSLTALKIVTEASFQPITVSEAKEHLRITHNAEDSYIQSLILAATDWAQQYMRRILCDTQVTISFDCFPSAHSDFYHNYADGGYYVVRENPFSRNLSRNTRDRSIYLPGGLVSAVNDIDYIDADGNPQTLTGPTSGTPGTDYQEDLTDDEWPFLYPAQAGSWPSTDDLAVNAVTIDYQTGWDDPSEIPESIRYAIKFKVGDMFSIRDTADAGNKSALLKAAENLIDPYAVPLP